MSILFWHIVVSFLAAWPGMIALNWQQAKRVEAIVRQQDRKIRELQMELLEVSQERVNLLKRVITN
jgi:hypothetical protein